MFRDRYGNPLFGENMIAVFDTDLNYDSELFEDTVGYKLRDFDRSRFKQAYEIDVGAGADWPTVACELLEQFVPFSVIAAAFFYGERIEKSALAWKRMAEALISCIPKSGFTDANGAALLALDAIFQKIGGRDARLIAYTWIDEHMSFFGDGKVKSSAFDVLIKLNEIKPREEQFGVGLHSPPTFLFKFEVEEKIILVKVHRDVAEILESKP